MEHLYVMPFRSSPFNLLHFRTCSLRAGDSQKLVDNQVQSHFVLRHKIKQIKMKTRYTCIFGIKSDWNWISFWKLWISTQCVQTNCDMLILNVGSNKILCVRLPFCKAWENWWKNFLIIIQWLICFSDKAKRSKQAEGAGWLVYWLFDLAMRHLFCQILDFCANRGNSPFFVLWSCWNMAYKLIY